MEGHHLHHPLHHHPHPQHPQHPQHHLSHHLPPSAGVSVNVDVADRFPQWNIQETKEFLMIRAELDQTFMETKRNKQLWEVISSRMREKGFSRSAEQCKCKWKNLVTRYKGYETMEPEAMRQQFPFYNELQAIFTSRMHRMLWAEAEGTATGSSKKKAVQLSSEDEEDNEESEGEKGPTRKKKKGKVSVGGSSSGGGGGLNNLKEILDEFMRQQMQIEGQWMEAFEARESERRIKELEWRQKMEALENERILMESKWREREDQRRIREEARAEKRDALITALLNKLRREDQM